MSKKFMKIMALLVISACILSQTSASLVGSCGSESSCCQDNSIYVSGNGKISVQPDIAYITVGVSVTEKSSQAASQGVAKKISQLTQILASNKISKSDYETQSLSIYPQYDYPDGKMTLVGQNAQQTLIVTVRNIDKNGGGLGALIDQLVAVDGVQLSGLTFDKEDKTTAQKYARKLAYNDAKRKALEFADYADRTLGKTLSVVDSSSSSSNPVSNRQTFSKMANVATDVSVGQLDIFYNINVKFALK